jgi:hypothetical protein
LVKNWSKVGQKLVKRWSSLSKFGQVDQKLTNLVKLVKNWSSWSKVGQKLTNLVKLIKKNVKLVKNWSSWSKVGQVGQKIDQLRLVGQKFVKSWSTVGRKFHLTNSTNSRAQEVLAANFRPLTNVLLCIF